MDILALEALLNQMKSLPQPRKTEANIFSSGARGHYENPVSDVLAFFLDPDGGHGLGHWRQRRCSAAWGWQTRSTPNCPHCLSVKSALEEGTGSTSCLRVKTG